MSYHYGEWGSAIEYETKLNENLKENFNLLVNGQLPKEYIGGPIMQFLDSLPYTEGLPVSWRRKYTENIGFPLFAENWVKPLAKWIGDRPCLEVMAGSGFLSYALSLYGCNIKSTDNFTWFPRFNKIYYNVEQMDCIEAIEKYGKDVKFILISWPYMDNDAYRCLKTMRTINPSCRMIYIGEDIGGCTADNLFFENLIECDVKSFREAVKKYRRWQGVSDSVWLIK